MSEPNANVATQTPPADPVITPVPQPAPAPEPVDDSVNIPKVQIGPGGFHEDLRRSREYVAMERDGVMELLQAYAQADLTPRQILDYWNNPTTPAADPNAQQPPQPQHPIQATDDDSMPATVGSMKKMYEEKEAENREKDLKERQKNEAIAERTRLFTIEDDFKLETIKELKIEPEIEGKENPRFEMAESFFDKCIRKAIKNSIPQHWSGDRKKQAPSAPANKSQLEEAANMFKAVMADFKNESVVDHARDESGLPPASLGGGPGGEAPPKNFDEMTFQEKREHLKNQMSRRGK